MEITLGSLFDGAGTCPFAAKQFGIKTLWSSEIEPFPLQVTAKRFPEVQQLGDITKINGGEIPPVDIITFGSPCQDLSVAGKRAGIEGARSGLFMEAVRIMREMRDATKGKYPRFAMWENVPGAFSSNNGDDFRTVLEELAKVKDSNAVIPRPTDSKGGQQRWTTAGHILADDYSIAWRTLDAQYWGIPQRRRRIYLVADFRGGSAAKILFERNGLSRNFAESRNSWQGLSRENTYSTLCADGTGQSDDSRSRGNGTEIAHPLILENHPNDSRIQVDDSGTIQTLTQQMGTGGGNVPLVVCGLDAYNQTETGNVAKTLLSGHADCDGVPCVAVNLVPNAVGGGSIHGNNR